MKTKYIIIGIIFPIFILAISFSAYYLIEPKPLVIFAGGGSVNNYLKSKGFNLIERKDFSNSVYINMPSGYVRQLLIEEIKRFGKKSEVKHPILNISLYNQEILDWNIESQKPFLYIGLSADTIKYDSSLYSEYAQVYEYYIGKDPLAVYYVKTSTDTDSVKTDSIKTDSIKIENLKNELKTIKKLGTNVFTTSPRSGTLNTYINIFKTATYDFEKELDSIHARVFFENETIKTDNCLVLSSYFYPPKKFNKNNNTIKRSIIKDNGTVVCKNLYIYFVGYKSRDSIYKPNSQVINILNKIDKKIYPNKNNFSNDNIWKIKTSSERKSIKKI